MSIRCCCVLVLVALVLHSSDLMAGVIFFDAPESGGTGMDYRISSITNVDVGGVLYDATFHENESVSSHPDPFSLSSGAEAEQAVLAMIAQIHAIGLIDYWDTHTYTWDFMVPVQASPTTISLYEATKVDFSAVPPGTQLVQYIDTYDLDGSASRVSTLVTFSPVNAAVPEPCSALAWIPIGWFLVRRRGARVAEVTAA